jgi:glycosyltransferase involved in cell wall biosynthesis
VAYRDRHIVKIVQMNYAFDEGVTDPEALVEQYSTLTGWSQALLAAGAQRVAVVQRFHRDAAFTRGGVDFVFRHDRSEPSAWTWPGRVHRAVLELNPDVAHVNGLTFPARTWLLRRALPPSAAIVVQDHATGVPRAQCSKPLGRAKQVVRRHAMRAIDGFMFSSAEQAVPWRDGGYIAPNQPVYEVMEASTDFTRLPRVAARQASGLEGTPAILWVGRLNPNKDPLTVLDAFERVLERMPGAILTMIFSADDLLPAVQERLRLSVLLARRVRLLGRVPHRLMPAYYSAADMFVLGSHHEGSGYAVLEACACGAVPVVTSIPPFRAITGNGSIGALWMAGDTSGCARALAEVARADLIEASARVQAHFDRALNWEAVGRKAMRAYEDVVRVRAGV